MTFARALLLPVLAAAALANVPAPAEAASGLLTTWALDPVKSDDVDRAISAAVDKVNFVIRGIAHGRLKSTNQPYKTVAITTRGADTATVMDGRAPIVAPSDGHPVKWKREDGQTYDVTFVWKGDNRLEQTFANDEGKRVNVYTLVPGGKAMSLAVTVSSGKLPVPLTYTLAYLRK